MMQDVVVGAPSPDCPVSISLESIDERIAVITEPMDCYKDASLYDGRVAPVAPFVHAFRGVEPHIIPVRGPYVGLFGSIELQYLNGPVVTDHSYVDIESVRLPYVEAGTGPPVIFFHGFPLFWFSFHHQMHALKDTYRVVAVDGLGVNLSSKPDDLSLYKLPSLAKQLGEMHQRITQNGADLMWQNAYANLRKLPHYTAEHDEIFRQGLAQPGAVDGGINWYRANIAPLDDISEEAFWPSRNASTPVPGLLIWGETDNTFVPEFIDDLPRYVDQLDVCRLPGIGHSPMLEAPEQVNDILRKFLAR